MRKWMISSELLVEESELISQLREEVSAVLDELDRNECYRKVNTTH